MTMNTVRVGVLIGLLLTAGWLGAVQVQFESHDSEEAFLKGKTDGVLVTSTGRLGLTYEAESLSADSNDVWLVNDLVSAEGVVYAATSGKGQLLRRVDEGACEVFYDGSKDGITHWFSLGVDGEGCLLAGSGGEAAQLVRWDSDGERGVVWEDPNVTYIWDILVDAGGETAYLATGPRGEVVAVELGSGDSRVVFDAEQGHIMCLAWDKQGRLVAGSNDEGIVYAIDTADGGYTVLYDSDYDEISALLVDAAGVIYAATGDAAASAEDMPWSLSDGREGRPVVKGQDEGRLPVEPGDPGEIDLGSDLGKGDDASIAEAGEDTGDGATDGDELMKDDGAGDSEAGRDALLNDDEDKAGEGGESREPAAMTFGAAIPLDEGEGGGSAIRMMMGGGMRPGGMMGGRRGGGSPQANAILRITPDGFVHELFHKEVVFYDMVFDGEGDLLLATGREGKLLRLKVAQEEAAVLYEASQAAQLTSLLRTAEGTVILGGGNPGELLELHERYCEAGTYESAVIDAEQVSQWGAVQLETIIPEGTTITIAARTSNIGDAKSDAWGQWSDETAASASVELSLPVGRFMQYRVTLHSDESQRLTPMVRGVRVSHLTANLAPKIRTVQWQGGRSGGGSRGSTNGQVVSGGDEGNGVHRVLRWEAEDANGDTLVYTVYLREAEGGPWVQVAEKLRETQWQFNTLTVEDGRYEVKVAGSDILDNLPDRALTAERISDVLLVDNSPAWVDELTYRVEGERLYLTLTVEDELSVINEVSYSVNSREQWQRLMPEDGVFDERRERIVTSFELGGAGRYWVTLRMSDAGDNVFYRNLTVDIP